MRTPGHGRGVLAGRAGELLILVVPRHALSRSKPLVSPLQLVDHVPRRQAVAFFFGECTRGSGEDLRRHIQGTDHRAGAERRKKTTPTQNRKRWKVCDRHRFHECSLLRDCLENGDRTGGHAARPAPLEFQRCSGGRCRRTDVDVRGRRATEVYLSRFQGWLSTCCEPLRLKIERNVIVGRQQSRRNKSARRRPVTAHRVSPSPSPRRSIEGLRRVGFLLDAA